MSIKQIYWRLWLTIDGFSLMAETVQEVLRASRLLPGDSPVRDSEILLGHCLGKSRSWLYTWPEAEISPAVLARYTALLERRRGGEPVAYLVGQREFWSLLLEVNQHTLIPRPETELLVEWVLALALPETALALDLGTGSGAIALALASERSGWHVVGLDASENALAVARRNTRACGLVNLEWLHSNWFNALHQRRFHVLMSNPPYIEEDDPHLKQGDVRFEPRAALVADEAGLADLRHIIDTAPSHLYPDAWLLLEHGFEQGQVTRKLLRSRGFSAVETRRDFAGLERVTAGQWKC